MAAEAGAVLPAEPVVISKGLSFTKKTYESMITDVMELTRVAKKNRWEKADVAGLYGIFYASVAGLIRSGALASRSTGIDGFPEIRIMAGNKEYHCRESVLYGILGLEADGLVTPYEDTFASYVSDHPFHFLTVPNGYAAALPEPETEETDKTVSRKKAKKTELSADEVRADYEKRLQALRDSQKLRTDKLQAALDAAKQELEETKQTLLEATSTIARVTQKEEDGDHRLLEENKVLNKQMEDLTRQLEESSGLEEENRNLSEQLEKARMQIDDLKARLEQPSGQKGFFQGRKSEKDLSAQLAASKKETKTLQGEITALTETNHTLLAETLALKQKIQDLETAGKTVSPGPDPEQIQQLRADIQTQKEQCAESEKETERLKALCADLEGRLQAEQELHLSGEESEIVRTLRDKLNEQTKEREQLAKNFQKLQKQVSESDSGFYNEELPKLILSLDTSTSDFLVRIFLMAVSFCGILGSLLFLS